MQDLIIAIGLVFVIEGLLWAVFPRRLLNLLKAMEQTPEQSLRLAGAMSVVIGVVIVSFVIN